MTNLKCSVNIYYKYLWLQGRVRVDVVDDAGTGHGHVGDGGDHVRGALVLLAPAIGHLVDPRAVRHPE